jgi:proteasome lid subunit RPN8/RPN11
MPIWLSDEAAELIEAASRQYDPDEIGGVLLGVTVNGRPWVTKSTLVVPERTSPTYYEIPAGARHDAVDQARRDDERVGYIGDWHSHPMDIAPSSTDRSTMRKLAADVESGCGEPILMLARRREDRYVFDPYQHRAGHLVALELIGAGALQPPTAEDAFPTRASPQARRPRTRQKRRN